MKLNLIYGTGSALSGYLNLDGAKGDPIDNLDEVCEDAECVSIIANDVIDFYASQSVDTIIANWVKKLRHEATIIIGGVHIGDVAKALVNNQIGLAEANLLLYGEQSEPWQFRKSALSANDLANALRQNWGLRIIKNRTNNYRYVVEARRM